MPIKRFDIFFRMKIRQQQIKNKKITSDNGYMKKYIVKVYQFLYNKNVEGTYRRYFIVMLAH